MNARETWLAVHRQSRTDPRAHPDTMELAVLAVIEWKVADLAAGGLGIGARNWLQEHGTTRQAAIHIVSDAVKRSAMTPEEARDLILAAAEQGYRQTLAPLIGTMPSGGPGTGGGGTGIVTDDYGQPIMVIDHKARIAYLDRIDRMTGAAMPTKQETKLDASDDLKAMLAKSRDPNPPQILPDKL